MIAHFFFWFGMCSLILAMVAMAGFFISGLVSGWSVGNRAHTLSPNGTLAQRKIRFRSVGKS